MAGGVITVGDRSTYTMIGYLDAGKYQQTYDIFSEYVDISNITAASAYTTYFYDLAVADQAYLDALDSFDSYAWDGRLRGALPGLIRPIQALRTPGRWPGVRQEKGPPPALYRKSGIKEEPLCTI